MKRRWLKDWPWQTVAAINAGLCKEKSAGRIAIIGARPWLGRTAGRHCVAEKEARRGKLGTFPYVRRREKAKRR
jgi:hypothetical protein